MAVGTPRQGILGKVKGVRMAAVAAGVRYRDRLDLVLFEIEKGANTAAVFTRNAFCAAPVHIARAHLQQASSRYFLVNTGNANAGTGEQGKLDALECCQAVAVQLGVNPNEVLPFSTGVIGEPLPIAKIKAGIPFAIADLSDAAWSSVAQGIMTTDTRPKALSVTLQHGGKTVTITGIAKGAGMIKPNMATLLAFVFTDANVETRLLDKLLRSVVDQSFNRITVDGDTSTNDCCTLVATGQSGLTIAETDDFYPVFVERLAFVFRELAKDIIRDAEGASKFIEIRVQEGGSSAECLAVAYAIAESPLVKTAIFASDPNWGRLLAAIGRAGLVDLNIDRIGVSLGDTQLVTNGCRAASYSEAAGQSEMQKEEIVITVNLSRGHAAETVWTSDLSHDYIRINADYRS